VDDILQRMLAVEQEAEEIVAEADRQADAILQAGRQGAADLEARRMRETSEEADALVHERMKAAEANRDHALAEAQQRLERRMATLCEKLNTSRGFVTRTLALLHQ